MNESQPQDIYSKKIELDNIVYSLNTNEKTAHLITNSLYSREEIIIPRSISYESNEYIITSINEEAFKQSLARFIRFPPDSEIRTIGNSAFSCVPIESFTLPPHLTTINPSVFCFCKRLRKFEIPPNSELQTICHDAFSNSAIESFTLPPHVTSIGNFAFAYCPRLLKFQIPENSQLQRLGDSVFFASSIERFTIPASLTDLDAGWCRGTSYLKTIKVDENNPRYSACGGAFIVGKSKIESKKFDVLLFCVRDVEGTTTIPSFIKQIGPFAFHQCIKLRNVEIPENSELEIIGDSAFSGSSIECFTIPSRVARIGGDAFSYCSKLQKIEIHQNSRLRMIGKYMFSFTEVRSFYIPRHLGQIDNCSFLWCKKIRIIEIDEKTDINYIDKRLFENCKEAYIMVPNKLVNYFK